MIKILTKLNKKLNNQQLILVFLALFSISIGLWSNFRQLWLSSNMLGASDIAKTISYASLLAALYLLYYTKVVSINKIKWGMAITLFIKLIMSTSLALVNGCCNIVLIKFLFFVDVACENIILSSVYPLMISYQKSEELYGKKTVIQYTYKTVGILIASLIFGKVIGSLQIDYNFCLIVSIFFLIFSFFTLLLVNSDGHNNVVESSKGIIRYLLNNKIVKKYFIYSIFANIAYNISIGLNMLVLTNFVGFSTNSATLYVLLFSILASLFGQLALNKLKSKNDYINISVKFLGRFILFLLVYFTNSTKVLLIAISYLLLTSVAYDYVIAGFIHNNIDSKYMMGFTVVNYIFTLVGEAIGVFLAGVMYNYGFSYIYLLSAIFMVFQLLFAYYIISVKRKTEQLN